MRKGTGQGCAGTREMGAVTTPSRCAWIFLLFEQATDSQLSTEICKTEHQITQRHIGVAFVVTVASLSSAKTAFILTSSAACLSVSEA